MRNTKKYLSEFLSPIINAPYFAGLALFLEITYVGIEIINVELFRQLISSVENRIGWEVTINYGISLLILITILFSLQFSTYWLKNGTVRTQFMNYLYKKYIDKYLLLDNERVARFGTGKFISVLNSGITDWYGTLELVFFYLIPIVFGYFSYIIYVYFLNKMLLIPIAIITGILYFFLWFGYYKAKPFRKKRKLIWEETSRQVVKIIMEKFTILKNNKSNQEIEKIFKLNEKLKKVQNSNEFFVTLVFEGGKNIVEIGQIIFILLVSYFVYIGTSSIADLGAILLVMTIIKNNTTNFAYMYGMVVDRSVSVHRLIEINEEIPTIEGYHEGKNFKFESGNINVDKIHFNYKGTNDIFKDFSLNIMGKKKTALVGKSGTGKSTLIKLILGFARPQKGNIIIDNQSMKDFSLKSYYKYIGYLSQDPSVFDGSVYENLTYGLENYNKIGDKRKKNSLKLAQCDFVNNLPEGLNTQIGEKGVRLSGGEKQRLAIARLLLQEPEIVILDEPTSALDSFSEQKIGEALKNLCKGKTLIVIAHRLQTVLDADEIIVFGKNEIIERGNHNELLKKKGPYSKMVDLQSGKIIE